MTLADDLMDLATNAATEHEMATLAAASVALRRYPEIIGQACESFYRMPYLNGAIRPAHVSDVRKECSEAIDTALALLHPIIGRGLTDAQAAIAATLGEYEPSGSGEPPPCICGHAKADHIDRMDDCMTGGCPCPLYSLGSGSEVTPR